ncbi:MAG: hypothetical protein V7641_1272 [Blastocatellia bacterium]
MSSSPTHEARPVALPLRASTGLLQRKCACDNRAGVGSDCDSCQKENASSKLQRAAVNAEPVAEVPPVVLDELRSPGQPLDPASRAFFESRFGHDFSSVRIHQGAKADESALAVNALAYTVGNDVVFEAGRYAPNTRDGRRLLAHELTHVVQQRSASKGISGKLKVGAVDDASERAADATAQAIDAGGAVEVASSRAAGVLHRQPGQKEQDPMHRGGIEDYRRRHGLPESGRDESGQPFGPTDAQIKYQTKPSVEDPSRIRIAAVPDFLASSLKAPRNVQVQVNDPQVVSLNWELHNPERATIARSSTTAAQANATKQPFVLEPAQFKDFVAGQYMLYCYGQDQNGDEVVYARRDFNVLSAELKQGKGLDTTYGKLIFTRYDPLDANLSDANPHYEVWVVLEFLPKEKVACDDVSFIQAVQGIDPGGQSRMSAVNPDIAARQTKLAWAIDQARDGRSPYYDTPPKRGANTESERSSYPGKGGAQPSKARLFDEPGAESATGNKSLPPRVARFESCAVCRSGKNIGQVYGCATWGFTADTSWHVTLMPPAFRQMPSEMFMEASAAWNVWRKTKPAGQPTDEIPGLKSP